MKGGFRKGQSLEGRLEQLRARAMIPTLDEHSPLEALRQILPDLECLPSGEVERQPHVVTGGRDITDIQQDRTRREEQREQKREQVILRAGIPDEILCESPCLIAKSLQPENAGVVALEYHSLVVLIEDDVRRPRSRRQARANQRLEVSSRTRLVSENVQRKTDEPAPYRHIGTIGRLCCDGAELLGETEGISILACGEAMGIESPYRSQPVPGVIHDLGKLERLRQRGVYVRVGACLTMHEEVAKREIEAHVAAWIGGHQTSEE